MCTVHVIAHDVELIWNLDTVVQSKLLSSSLLRSAM